VAFVSLDRQRPNLFAAKNSQRTPRGRLRQPAPKKQVAKAAPLTLQDFRLTALHGGGGRTSLDSMVTGVSWTEPQDSAIWTGSISLVAPAYDVRSQIKVRPGDRILCEVSASGQARYRPVWTLRVREPSMSARDGTFQFALSNDLALLAQSIDDFKYGKSKKRPQGWRVDDAIKDVATRFGLKLNQIAAMATKVKRKVALDTSPLRIINDLMLAERHKTGRRYVLHFDANGRLNIVPLKRSSDLLLMAGAIIDAQMQQSFDAEFATSLTVRSTSAVTAGAGGVKKKAKSKAKRVTAKKISVIVESKPAIKAFGYVHRTVYAHGADSIAEARQMGQYHLARIAKLQRTLTVTHPGIVTVHKGDSIRLDLPEIGVKQVVWVAEVTHNVAPGDYTMDVTLVFDDPFVDKKADRVDENKIAAAVLRGRKTKAKKKAAPSPTRNRATIDKPKGPSKGDKLKAAAGR
jgi:hypothetical protein